MRARRLGLAIMIAAITVVAGFTTYVYVSNACLLRQEYPVERVALVAAAGPAAIARGRAIADVTGCTDCHRADLRGGTFIDEGWWHGRYYAANLTRIAARYSDADLARVVRSGVRPDGHGVIVMPSFGFVRLTDAEMGDLIAFIRSMPPGGPEQPDHHIGPIDQWETWRGKYKPAVTYVAEERTREPPAAGPAHEPARHLVGIVCAECHRGDLRGNGGDSGAPDLVVAAAYGLPEFTRLLRTGIALRGNELDLMTRVARSRLHRLSDEQIAAIHAYLLERARSLR